MVNPIYQQGEELLLNQFGSKYLGVAAHTNVNSNEFIVQEDAVISVLTGGDSSIAANDVDYKSSMSLSGVTLKQGALIVAPQGESFQSMTIDSGTIMAYNSVLGGTKPSSFVGLLDDYPNAAAAYSLRKLRNAYTGSAIEVRRTVGTPSNTNIGFVNGELDTAALISFVGSGDGFVSKWYDQSGNGIDTVQSVASRQPKIYDSSTGVILGGSKAMMEFDGVDDTFKIDFITSETNASYYMSNFQGYSVANGRYLGDNNNLTVGLDKQYYFAGTSDPSLRNGGSTATGTSLTLFNSPAIVGIIFDNTTTARVYENNSTVKNRTVSGGSSTRYLTIANWEDGGIRAGRMDLSEIIVWRDADATRQQGVKTNQNNYYAIY